jgi:hypothetical protein
MTKTKQARAKKTGQYSFSKMDAVCAHCGLTLGSHEAEAPHAQGDEGMGPLCEGFKPGK